MPKFTPVYTPANIAQESDQVKLRNRLKELNQMKRTSSVAINPDELQARKFDAMAMAYGEQDPEKMLDLQIRAQQSRDKAAQKAKEEAERKGPDAERYKIQSALNQVVQESGAYVTKYGADPSDPSYAGRVALIKALRAELAADNPSMQRAYINANQPEKAEVVQNAPAGTTDLSYETLVSRINSAKSNNDLKGVQIDIPKSKVLSTTNVATLNDLIDIRKKEIAPKAERVSTTKSEALADIKVALANLALGSNASSLKPGNSADAQILWKVQQRGYTPEAVNEGDLTLGRTWMEKAVSKITGVPPTIPVEEAAQARAFIKSSIYDPASKSLNRLLQDKKNVSDYSATKIKEALSSYKWSGQGLGGTASTGNTSKSGYTYEVVQ